ncbi:MAG TPA: hypothetical protein VM889_09230 [Candidatus Thermoplasmatota archaeon]|nr:hypothetical protein [Candidatus Thermoplasmatota archaeon]
MAETRRDLVKTVWPDKLLFGAIMLLVTSAIGLLHGLVGMAVDIRYGKKVPEFLVAMPPEGTVVLSAAAAVLAVLALRRVQTSFGIAGAVSGVLALGLLGLGSLFSLIALGFLVVARQEGEDTTPETARLAPEDWPDKSLAASLLLFMAGGVNVVWGLALILDVVGFGTMGAVVGPLAAAAGLFGLVASWSLYHQRGAKRGTVAALLNVFALGAYVLGPLLAVAALVLIGKARAEGEFAVRARPASAAAPVANPPAPKGP